MSWHDSKVEACLVVWIAPFKAGYFSPGNFAVVQNARQFNLERGKWQSIRGPFSGLLLPQTLTVGVVWWDLIIGPHIDPRAPLVLYYGALRAGQLGPFER
jgi:hypothetical protein